MARRFERRLVVTIAAVVGVALGRFIPLPGLPGVIREGFWASAQPTAPPYALLGLGIQPYLLAAVLLLLASGASARLRRAREGSADERRGFDGGIVWLALAVALLQSTASAVFVRNVASLQPFHQSVSVPLLVASQTAGTFLLLGVAELVSRWGLGNGLLVVYLACGPLPRLAMGLLAEGARLHDQADLYRAPLMLLLFGALVASYAWFLTSAESLPIESADAVDDGPPAASDAPPLRLRLNLVGILPVSLTLTALMIPSMLVRSVAGAFGRPLEWPAWVWALGIGLMAVFAYVVTAFTFDTSRVSERIGVLGFRLRDVAPSDVERHLDRLIERRTLAAIAFLAAVLVLPELARHWELVEDRFAWVVGTELLVLLAVVLELVRQGRAALALDAAAGDSPVSADSAAAEERWAEAFEAETELEARLVIHRLREHSIGGVLLPSRMMSITGSPAPWEWTVPRFPSLAIHRRLGGGRVVVVVPAADAARAAALLAGERPGTLAGA